MAEIILKVDSAYPEDQGLGKARLDPQSMKELDVRPGDIIKIKGNAETYAKVWRALANDWGGDKVRIDKYTRANAGVNPGDKVTLSKVENEIKAEVVTLIPPNGVSREFLNEDNLDLNALVNYPVAAGDIIPIRTFLFGTAAIEFKISSIEPEGACLISSTTEYDLDSDTIGFDGTKKITYEDIGGLKNELRRVREMIELPIRHPELFETMGIESPKGVLLYGPPGTGKTLIAKAVANESGANFISIAGPEIISKYYGESEQKLREIFEDAEQNAPSIIFIDELDSIATRREDVSGEVERRVVAQLLTMLDGISERGQVIVIGATNRPDAIDPALRRPGRFDREIEIGVPSEADRLEILKIHTKDMPFEGRAKLTDNPDDETRAEYENSRNRILAELASISKGFVGADLAALAREGAVSALRRQLGSIDIDAEKIPEEELKKLQVTREDFILAAREMTPSAMREISLETPNVHWSDIGGCKTALRDIRESVEYPLTKKESFANLGIRAPKGVLLYGPPGTGKTLIAKAVANESGANFIAVKGPQLLSKWVGESERAVREMFKKARQVAPSVIFFDEIDSLTPARNGEDSSHTTENVLNQILTEMDGIEELNDVIILAASNRPDIIDSALLRSGRFDRLVYIPEPSLSDREEILKVHLKNIPLKNSALDEVVSGFRDLSDESISKVSEKLKDRSVTAKQVLNAAKKMPKVSERKLTDVRSKIYESFEKNNVTLKDLPRHELIEKIAKETEGFVGSDLEGLCREAAMIALREGADYVSEDNFESAKQNIHPTMNPRVREYYEKIRSGFKGGLPKEIQNFVEYQ